jgi:ABC-type polysaccharide/polyol phosphate export permease
MPPTTMTLIQPAAGRRVEPRTHRIGGEREALGQDLYEGLRAWPLWTMLGWEDIRQRYRRSVIGPFWITLSMGMFITILGLMYSRIFRMDIAVYLPFLALGLTVWGYIAACVNESCSAFQEGERVIKQVKWPFSIYILRTVWRNLIIFFHTIVIYVPLAILFGIKPHFVNILAIPGLVLLFLNLIWLCLALAILAARFRDVVPIVNTLVTVMMFATPIMWPVSTLADVTWVAEINPVYHLIELIRAPILGQYPSMLSWVVAVGMLIAGSICAMLLFRRVARRIVYWL